MGSKDYNQIIFEKIEQSFDVVLPIGGVVSFLMTILVFISKKPIGYVIFDLVITLLFTGLYIARKQILVRYKVIVVIGVLYLFSMKSIMDFGFIGTGFMILAITNVLAASFFRTKETIIYAVVLSISVIGVGVLMVTGILRYETGFAPEPNNGVDWFMHLSVFLVFVVLCHGVLRSIKRYLSDSMMELENSIDKTYDLAYYDQLTNLPNRNMFTEELLHRTDNGHVKGYLVLFDLKSFKIINSIYGSDLGDEILAKIALIFTELKGDREMIARISGNEFAWWMEGLTYKTLTYRLDYLKEQFYKRLRSLGITKKIEFHISYAHYPNDGKTVEQVYQKATMALESAKMNRKANVVPYNRGIEKQTREEEGLKELLLDAIENDNFVIAYQEKVDGRTGEVVSLEALARWYVEDKGWISPSVFVPIVEKGNMAVPFGQCIIRKVMEDYTELKKVYNEDIVISINASPTYLCYKGFKVFLMEEISKRNYDPTHFVIEITEEVMIEGIDEVMEIIKPLRDFGIGISLDDFGTGYSSLRYLAELELDELKIDKSFIDRLGKEDKSKALLDAIVRLGQALNIRIVAEGVETREQCDLLISLGCELIQGYYFSKPKRLIEMIELDVM